MAHIEKSTELDVPVRTAYNQWTQFEEFPQFMEGVESVTQMDDTRLHWVAEIGGRRKEWEARITEQRPDERVAWTSETGTYNAGTARFEPVGADRTRLTLEIEYTPENVVEGIGDMLGFLDRQVEGDLRRFKEFIETRGQETGAWRGEVSGGREVSGGSHGGASV